ncbi:hypothetical protein D3C81_2098300 [compost metagenome]
MNPYFIVAVCSEFDVTFSHAEVKLEALAFISPAKAGVAFPNTSAATNNPEIIFFTFFIT